MWMHPHSIKLMETNTNTPEAKQPASAGCHRTTCCASFWRAGWERKLNEMVADHIAAGKHIGGSIENFECGQVAVRTGMAVCRHRQEITKSRHNRELEQPKPESKDPHRFCRGGGGNNFHCGCKYDG